MLLKPLVSGRSGQARSAQTHAGSAARKQQHTLKTQVVIDVATHMILCVATGFGFMHDLTLFGTRASTIHREAALMATSAIRDLARPWSLGHTVKGRESPFR